MATKAYKVTPSQFGILLPDRIGWQSKRESTKCSYLICSEFEINAFVSSNQKDPEVHISFSLVSKLHFEAAELLHQLN